MQTRSPGGPQLSNGHITLDPADVRQFPVPSFVAEDSRRNHRVLGTPSHRRFFKSSLLPIFQNNFTGTIRTRRMTGDFHRQQQNFVRLFIDSPNNHRTFFGYFRLVLVARGHASNFKQLRFSKPISCHHPSMRPAQPPHRLLFTVFGTGSRVFSNSITKSGAPFPDRRGRRPTSSGDESASQSQYARKFSAMVVTSPRRVFAARDPADPARWDHSLREARCRRPAAERRVPAGRRP